MNVIIFKDKHDETQLQQDVLKKVKAIFKENKYPVTEIEVGKNDVLPCAGCMYCFLKSNGECIRKDLIWEINKTIKNYDVIIYLGRSVFGQFTSTMKNITEKARLLKKGWVPLQIVIGYDNEITDEERSTFIDITKKHCGEANIVHPLLPDRVEVFVSSSVQDNDKIEKDLRAVIS
jgi:multimeric flavodoxin WrbA